MENRHIYLLIVIRVGGKPSPAHGSQPCRRGRGWKQGEQRSPGQSRVDVGPLPCLPHQSMRAHVCADPSSAGMWGGS